MFDFAPFSALVFEIYRQVFMGAVKDENLTLSDIHQ
jgi:hypothetical protein